MVEGGLLDTNRYNDTLQQQLTLCDDNDGPGLCSAHKDENDHQEEKEYQGIDQGNFDDRVNKDIQNENKNDGNDTGIQDYENETAYDQRQQRQLQRNEGPWHYKRHYYVLPCLNCCCCRHHRQKKGCCCSQERNPRLFAITFGILLPLLGLVCISIFFGYFITQIESPIEYMKNDAQMLTSTILRKKLDLITELPIISPQICFLLFFRNITFENTTYIEDILFTNDDNDDLLLPTLSDTNNNEYYFHTTDIQYWKEERDKLYESYNNSVDNNNIDTTSNLQTMYEFLTACSEQFRYYIKRYYNDFQFLDKGNVGTPTLTFNWIQCTPYEFTDDNHLVSLRLFNQTEYYSNTWKNDTLRLYDIYYTYYTTYPNNVSSSKVAMLLAENRSIHEATGSTGCTINLFSGAWFWFTIMTTIGYGNTSIESSMSRTLIYTFGFISIIIFASISLRAGSITAAIFEDTIIRFRGKMFTKAWMLACFWGSLYYSWMLIIARNYRDWTFYRLGTTDIGLNDGFWFAYISTTTVGLGDYVLDPTVLSATDMVAWPCILLLGFVFLAAFICSVSNMIFTSSYDFTERLRDTNMMYGNERSDNDNSEGDDLNVPTTINKNMSGNTGEQTNVDVCNSVFQDNNTTEEGVKGEKL